MSDIKISVDTTELPQVDGEITIVRVDGVIDTMTAHELEKVTNSLLAQKRYKIVVDLGGVDYISSAGWGIFISNIREIRLNNGDIKLARMIPNVYEIFELLEFDSILRAFDNIEKAKADFGTGAAEKPTVAATVKAGASEKPRISDSKPTITMGDAVQPKTGLEQKPASLSAAARPVSTGKTIIAKSEIPKAARKVDEAILELIGKDPFLSIGEIKREIAKDFPGTGIIKIWWMLKKLGLGSKKKRFYFARTRNLSS
ncbi:MAG: STAS domain-containing protein [candidate division Zixibacteria bacterium]|jgi:anti-sigma B factor antagonist|nr:STAS domain-containing protein [candidate division Zixibacteria bacterium]